jgi:hypothetical protein
MVVVGEAKALLTSSSKLLLLPPVSVSTAMPPLMLVVLLITGGPARFPTNIFFLLLCVKERERVKLHSHKDERWV